MPDIDQITAIIGVAANEVLLFAAVGFLIGGIDDLIVDLIWLVRVVWRQLFIFSWRRRGHLNALPPARPG